MAQPMEYTVKQWSGWTDKETSEPVRDMHGNYKGSVIFEEDASEPIDATFKTPPEPGQKKFGVVDLYTTKAGKVRKGYKAAQRPIPDNRSYQVSNDTQPINKNYTPTTDEATRESINRSVALKAAVDYVAREGADYNSKEVLKHADTFLAWLNNEKPKMDLSPNPLDRIFQGNEQYEGNPNSIPFTD